MTEDSPANPKPMSIDSLLRGVLAKLGDIFDGFTGRQRKPTSGLATSSLIERLKAILDSEAREVLGKGKVVPYSITLKMQWDKFETDDPAIIEALENELFVAAMDHINDQRYYTAAPFSVVVKPDYFTEGIRFIASFDPASDKDEDEKEIQLAMPSLAVDPGSGTSDPVKDSEGMEQPASGPTAFICAARFTLAGFENEVKIRVPAPGRVSVGRTAESMLRIEDDSVSKHHATLAVSETGELAVADTGSTNGTKVNGEKIAYGAAVAVKNDDVVTFGAVDVKFEVIPEDEAAETNKERGDE
ncbi:MAG: FHA domain-containing protein [Acidobacteria bacterium OLB17]|nr:MAG: FHA domain-containing protein [Acidobacteria bacterium OLB17]MCZ2389563.1 FHA domain-containing protein [Acidobacteriota bacterium]